MRVIYLESAHKEIVKLPEPVKAKLSALLLKFRATEVVPSKYVKKLYGSQLCEIRVKSPSGIYRLLGTIVGGTLILSRAFCKKTNKTPSREIKLAENRIRSYLKSL